MKRFSSILPLTIISKVCRVHPSIIHQAHSLVILICLIAGLASSDSAYAQTWCTPNNSGDYTACDVSKLGSSQYMGIKKVQVGSSVVYDVADCVFDVSYTDYTATNSATVTQGHSYVFNVERHTGDTYTAHMAVFVDWNNDGTFQNVLGGERILNSGALNTATPLYNSPAITIPFTSNLGSLRMRVMSNYNAAVPDPCNTAQGQTYDFTLNVLAGEACSGAPAVASVSPATSTKCSGTTSTLSLTGLAPASGYSYQWKVSSSASGPFTNASGTATNNTYTTPATLPYATSYYLCEVTCSGITTVSNTAQVGTTPFLNCYCTAAFTSGTQTNRGIAAVALNGSPAISTTGTNTANTYTDYTALTPAGLALGASYSLTITSGTQNTVSYIRAWIDYNHNGIFDSGEALGVGSPSPNASGTLTLTFTVPGDAMTGPTRLRIRSRYSSTLAATDACTSFNSAGETEDYLVDITGTACDGTPTPGTVSVTNPVSGSICSGGTATMSISGQTIGVSGITYQWKYWNGTAYVNVVGGSGATSITYTTPALTNGTSSDMTMLYKCEISCSSSGLSAIQTTPATVTIRPIPAINVTSSGSTICNVSSTTLSASNSSTGTTTYAWSPSTGLSATTGASVTASPSVTTTYSVVGTANGCSGPAATVTVVVNPSTITFSPAAPSIGIGTGTTITASATSTNGAVSYTWSPATGLSSTTGATVTASPLTTTTYTVTANDGMCTRTGTVTVNVMSGTPGLVSCGYSFSTASGYTAISGATSLGNLGNNNATIDLSSLSPAFNFDFNGITYNKFGVNGNGWMYVGDAVPTASINTPISSTATVDGVIAPWAASLSVAVSYVVQGTAPNRTLKVQWSAYGSSATDFQAILYENGGANSNVIEFAYRDQSGTLTSMSGSKQIGLRGATNADFNNRYKSSAGNMTINSSSAGTSNTDGINFSGSVYQSGNFTWRFTPTIATPTYTPSGEQHICLGESMEFSGTSVLPATPTSWQWKKSGVEVGTAQNFTATPSTEGNHFYTVTVTNATGCSRTSSAAVVVAEVCAPYIEAQPATSVVGCTNGSVTISAEVTNGIGFQWQASSNNGTSWYNVTNSTRYSGATTSSLTITNPLASMSGYMFRLRVSNDSGIVISQSSSLSVQTCPANDNPSSSNPTLTYPNYVYPNVIQVSGSTLNATVNPATGTRDVWYRLQAMSNGVSIKVSSSVIDPIIYLFEANDLTTPLEVENLMNGSQAEILNFAGLIPGHNYRIAIASVSEVDGDFSIVTQQLRMPQCATTGEVSMCEFLFTSVTGAHNVLYSFTDVATDVTTSYSASGNSMLLSSSAAQLRYGATYEAQYTARYNLQDGMGQAEVIEVPNTSNCSITIAPHRLIEVKANNRCANGAVHTRSGYLYGDYVGNGGMCNITGFKFEFTPVANCAGNDPQVLDKFEKTVSGGNLGISLNYAFNHMPLSENPNLGYWSVRIKPRMSGYDGEYGAARVIAVNGTSPAASMALNEAPVANGLINSTNTVDANIYPNPNNGELVNLNITGITSNEVYVRIMDSMGREVYTNRYLVDGSLNTMLNFGQSLAQGVYILEMRAGEVVKTQRMVVTK